MSFPWLVPALAKKYRRENENFPLSRTFELSVDFCPLALLMTDKLEIVMLYEYEK